MLGIDCDTANNLSVLGARQHRDEVRRSLGHLEGLEGHVNKVGDDRPPWGDHSVVGRPSCRFALSRSLA